MTTLQLVACLSRADGQMYQFLVTSKSNSYDDKETDVHVLKFQLFDFKKAHQNTIADVFEIHGIQQITECLRYTNLCIVI